MAFDSVTIVNLLIFHYIIIDLMIRMEMNRLENIETCTNLLIHGPMPNFFLTVIIANEVVFSTWESIIIDYIFEYRIKAKIDY